MFILLLFYEQQKNILTLLGKWRPQTDLLANFLIFSKKVGNTLDFRAVFLYNKYLDNPNENNKQGDIRT